MGSRITRAEAKKLKERLKCSERYYELAFKDFACRCLDLWRGKHWKGRKLAERDNAVVVNMIQYAVRTMFHSVTFNRGESIIRPQTPQAEGNLDTAKRATDYEYRVSKAHDAVLAAAWDYFVFDLGVVMTGWEFKTDEVHLQDGRQPVEGEEPEPEAVLKAVEEGQPLPEPVPAQKVRKDQFGCWRIDPRRFLVDPEGGPDIQKHRFVGYRECVPLEDVKRDARYKNTKNLKGGTQNTEGYFSKEMREKDPTELPADVKRVELIHYYEMERRLHLVFCDEHDMPLLEESWHWEFDGYPFVVIGEPGSQDEFYPNPPRLMHWEHMQREINQSRSQLAAIRERCNPWFAAQTGSLTQQSRKQLEAGTINRVVDVNGDPKGSVVPMDAARLPIDFYNAVEKAEADFRILSGLSQYEAGQTPTKRLTTAEVQAISGSSAALRRGDVQKFENFVAEVMHHCLYWLQQFANKTRSLPIYQHSQLVSWTDYTAQDIQGDYDFEVYSGSTEIKDQKGRLEEFSYAMQTLTPFFQMPGPDGQPVVKNPGELLRQMLNSLPEVRNVDAILGASAPATSPGMLPGMLPGMSGEGGPAAMPAPEGGMALPPELLAQLGPMMEAQNGVG